MRNYTNDVTGATKISNRFRQVHIAYWRNSRRSSFYAAAFESRWHR